MFSKLREVAEQFDAFALEVAANRPENLRLINDQVISKVGFPNLDLVNQVKPN